MSLPPVKLSSTFVFFQQETPRSGQKETGSKVVQNRKTPRSQGIIGTGLTQGPETISQSAQGRPELHTPKLSLSSCKGFRQVNPQHMQDRKKQPLSKFNLHRSVDLDFSFTPTPLGPHRKRAWEVFCSFVVPKG